MRRSIPRPWWRPSDCDYTGAALARDRTPEAGHRARVSDAGVGEVEHQRAHAGRLLPAAFAGVAHSAAIHGDRHVGCVRREGSRRWWRVDGTGGGAGGPGRSGAPLGWGASTETTAGGRGGDP